MITAVDTNILLYVLNQDSTYVEEARLVLRESLVEGQVVMSEAVYAEVAARFGAGADLLSFLTETGVRLLPSTGQSLQLAGRSWRTYTARRPQGLACPRCGAAQDVPCARCGAPIQARQHLVADFMIGAHALVQADRLVTRDRGFYRGYFPELSLA